MNEKKERHPKHEEAREHMRAARDEMRASFKAMVPPEFIEHRRNARKEMLLALRSVLDKALERHEEE